MFEEPDQRQIPAPNLVGSQGLGVDIDEESTAKCYTAPPRCPVKRLEDGSVHKW